MNDGSLTRGREAGIDLQRWGLHGDQVEVFNP